MGPCEGHGRWTLGDVRSGSCLKFFFLYTAGLMLSLSVRGHKDIQEEPVFTLGWRRRAPAGWTMKGDGDKGVDMPSRGDKL